MLSSPQHRMYLYDSIITETRVYFDPYNQTRKDPLRLAPPAAAAPIRGFGTAWDKKSEQAYHVAYSDVVEVIRNLFYPLSYSSGRQCAVDFVQDPLALKNSTFNGAFMRIAETAHPG